MYGQGALINGVHLSMDPCSYRIALDNSPCMDLSVVASGLLTRGATLLGGSSNGNSSHGQEMSIGLVPESHAERGEFVFFAEFEFLE